MRTARPSPPLAWLLAAKVALLVLQVVGAVWPEVGGFEGKGMAFRLRSSPSRRWWCRHGAPGAVARGRWRSMPA